jgi:hypothetical protein
MSDTSPWIRGFLRVAFLVLAVLLGRNAEAQSVTLAWNPSAGRTVAGYTVYYGDNSAAYDSEFNAGTNFTATISQLQPGLTYYFEVVAYDTNHEESPPSLPVAYTVPVVTKTVAVTANPPSEGRVSGGGVFAEGSQVTVTASPNSGYIFTAWTLNGQTVSSSASYTFTLESNTSLTANFIPITVTYNVTASAGSNGGVSPSGSETVNAGGSVSFVATPAAGYQVGQWLVNGVVAQNGGANFTLTGVAADTTVGVNFTTEPTVAVMANPANAGTVSGGGVYPSGTTVTVTAVAKSGYSFTNWTENGVIQSGSPGYTFVLSASRNLVANFAANQAIYTVTGGAGNNGSVSPSGPLPVGAGSGVTFTATPGTGYQVNQWLVNGLVAQSGGLTFALQNVESNTAVTVSFSAEPTVVVTASPANGGSVTGAGSYEMGSIVAVTAAANYGYTFTNWMENGAVISASPNYSFVISGNRNLVANFTANPVIYSVSATASAGGSVTPTGAQAVTSGGSITFTATAASGYEIDGWLVGGVSMDTNGAVFTLQNVTSNTLVEVNFTAIQTAPTNYYSTNVMLAVKGRGSVSPYRRGQVFKLGKKYAITATPAKGMLFANWSSNGTVVATAPTYAFFAESNLLLTASFVTNPFIPVDGVYRGLFYDTNDISQASSGGFIATVASSGAFSARIALGEATYTANGKFSLTGGANLTIPRGKLPPITAQLQLNLAGGPMVGTVSEGTWSVPLTAEPAIYAATNPAPQAGRYTLVIPGGYNASAAPAGNGFGALTVSSLGQITFGGALGDGTAISMSSVVGGDGAWPFYLSLDGGRETLFGWLEFEDNGTIGGQMAWFKQPQPGARYYPGGFAMLTAVVGSTYQVTRNVAPFNMVSDLVSLGGGNLAQSFSVQTGAASQILGIASSLNSLTLSTANGYFHATIVDPVTSQKIPVAGVVLQKQNYGAGLFLGASESGNVILTPGQ